MSENILSDENLNLLESGITILFYIAMLVGAATTSYGMYTSSAGSVHIPFLTGLGTIIGSYIVIIGLSTVSQDAYSNLYDDLYRPRSVKTTDEGEWINVTARKIPTGSSLILAEKDETNIADYTNSPREFSSVQQEFKLKEEHSGVRFKTEDYTEVFKDKEIEDMRLHLYRNSTQCRWVGNIIKVNN